MNQSIAEVPSTRPQRPVFGRFLQYLRALGFQVENRPDGIVDCREPTSDTVLLFRGRSDDDLVRDHELFLTRIQLAIHGLVAEPEFDRMMNASFQPTT